LARSISEIEHLRRLNAYNKYHTLVEAAKALCIDYRTMKRWAASNGVRSKRNSIHEERKRIYREGGSPEEIAHKMGLSLSGLYTWCRRQNLPTPNASKQLVKFSSRVSFIDFANHKVGKKAKKKSWVSNKPERERLLVRAFMADLLRIADTHPDKKEYDVESFMAEWVALNRLGDFICV
jgi:hypothetical protein